ncbi:MAG: tRNA (adenosine(37)-N6)-threonylcarbamoyltransferase complex ATPase subunit type 1 TsaE [Bythopirellula sp.]|nr:tRNA (adenosine(37)-N6)-threonylcarbamoyltransferase complex ATPase subunit type 1 TsaE [Bythopirellula sp.]
MSSFYFPANSEADTDRLGEWLAEVLPAGSVVALVGTLGAGKTRLVQAVAAALGVPRDEITSPTFVLVNEYLGGRLPVYHFDTYRLRDEDEFLELGPEEYFTGQGITFVEWADRFEKFLPAGYLKIEIVPVGATEREFTISATAAEYESVIQSLEELATKSTKSHKK